MGTSPTVIVALEARPVGEHTAAQPIPVEVAPIILDASHSAGRAFGADGTPMAVLIDVEGNIASEIATGAAAVLALANGQD